MSVHRSLKSGSGLLRLRNVWTRIERLQALQKEGRWNEEENSVLGLPKVRTRFKVISRKKAKQAAKDEAEKAKTPE